MDKLLIGILGAAGVGILLIVFCLIGAVCGAISGWVVGWVFDETMQKLLVNVLHLDNVAMWELGAMLGFIGGFFRGSSSSSSS